MFVHLGQKSRRRFHKTIGLAPQLCTHLAEMTPQNATSKRLFAIQQYGAGYCGAVVGEDGALVALVDGAYRDGDWPR